MSGVGTSSCARAGCTFRHKWKALGSTPFCCRACNRGEAWHTSNCEGAGQAIVKTLQPRSRSRSRSSNCEEAGTAEQEVGRAMMKFLMPAKFTRWQWKLSVVEYICWLAHSHDEMLFPQVQEAWLRTQFIVDKLGDPGIHLDVYIHKGSVVYGTASAAFIDVANSFPLSAKSNAYYMSDVSGVNLCVQANLVTQVYTAKAIEEAVVRVEWQRRSSTERQSIAFACDHGTHRSFGCGCLLLSLVYPAARIVPCTHRTRKDAILYLRADDSA